MALKDEIIAELTAPGGEFELEQMQVSGVPVRVYKKAPPSFRAVLEATAAFGDQPFLVYEDEVITYREHLEKVAALATRLREAGIRKGDRVAIGMRNYPEWMISFWACQAIGAVVVALNAWWIEPELAFALSDSGARALIIDGERLARLEAIIPKLGLAAVMVTRATTIPRGLEAFSDVVSKSPAGLPPAEIGPDDYATILYTSGTSGRPKGAPATHRNHITNLMNSLLAGAVGRQMAAALTPQSDQLPPQPVALQTFPFFHIGGLSGLYVSTAVGAKLVLMYRWDAAHAAELVEKHRIVSASGVPIVVRQLLQAASETGRDLSSLQGVASGGAPVPPDLIRRIGKDFEAKVAPGNGYGLTETTSAVITNSGADYLARPDSVGKPVVTADVRVVDDNGRDCAGGDIGEIWIRGANVIPGYWNNPEATAAAFTNGWFHTGDLGYRDAEGFYHVVDRKKDMIIRGGENIYCAEVEAVLLEHPGVRDAAVVGVPDPAYGEQVGAIIQRALDWEPQDLEAALSGFLVDRLARFKIPTRYHFIDQELPRTATGKVLKRELRQNYFK